MFNLIFKNLIKNYSTVRFILFLVSIFSLLSIILIHNFLYGYFFGGSGEKFSNFYLVTNFIKFTPLTISFVIFIFWGLYYFLSSIINMIKVENFPNKFIKYVSIIFMIAVVIVAVTFILTFTFAQDFNFKNYLKYLLVTLIMMILVGVVMYTLSRLIYSLFINPSIFFTAFFYNVSFVLMIYKIKQVFNLNDLIVLIPCIFITPVTLYIIHVLSTCKRKNIMLIAFFCSLSLMILIILLYFIPIGVFPIDSPTIFQQIVILIVIIFVLVLYFIVTFYIVEIFLEENDPGGIESKVELDKSSIGYILAEKGILSVIWDVTLKLFDVKALTNSENVTVNQEDDEGTKNNEQSAKSNESFGIKAVIILAVIISFLITSQSALNAGYYVRSTFVANEKAGFCIKFINEEKKPQYVKSNYYMNNGDEIIYSNENWNLSVFKSDNYNLNVIKSNSDCKTEDETQFNDKICVFPTRMFSQVDYCAASAFLFSRKQSQSNKTLLSSFYELSPTVWTVE
ncbi:hypothetical protein SZL87_15150 [Exiguobacterium indicum]|uniref:Uncharacterized protein n=1 Tax=Exiguobacterium indicum TaxID=296995 RepID=A0ABU8ELH9_9BACL